MKPVAGREDHPLAIHDTACPCWMAPATQHRLSVPALPRSCQSWPSGASLARAWTPCRTGCIWMLGLSWACWVPHVPPDFRSTFLSFGHSSRGQRCSVAVMGHCVVPQPSSFMSLGSGMCICCLCISCKGHLSCLCQLCGGCGSSPVGASSPGCNLAPEPPGLGAGWHPARLCHCSVVWVLACPSVRKS